MNYIIESQVSYSNSSWGCSVHMYNGECIAKIQNISHNTCKFYSGIKYKSGSMCTITYSSFYNNTATQYSIIGIQLSKEGTINITNIIYNTQNSLDNGIICSDNSEVEISGTCIFQNEPFTKTFFCFSSNDIITLINCTIDNFETNVNIIKDSLSPSPKSFFHMLKLMNTGKCYGTFDIVEGITFDPPTPEPTQSPTPRVHINGCTCKLVKRKIVPIILGSSLLS